MISWLEISVSRKSTQHHRLIDNTSILTVWTKIKHKEEAGTFIAKSDLQGRSAAIWRGGGNKLRSGKKMARRRMSDSRCGLYPVGGGGDRPPAAGEGPEQGTREIGRRRRRC